MESGLRQGCPLSPFLFILAVDKMAEAIRNKDNIRGVNLGDGEYKISQYADDSTIFVKDGESLEQALELVQDFGKVSGLHLNIQKSKVLRINTESVCKELGSKLISDGKINILGLDFYAEERSEQQVIAGFDRMKEKCSKWRSRRLPLKGRVIVMNSLVLPIIYYAAQNSFCPSSVSSTVCQLVSNFLWNGRVPSIGMKTLVLPVDKGGLGLHDFNARLQASRIMWVRRMVTSPADFWTDFICCRAGVSTIIEVPLRKTRMILRNLPPFYRAIFSAWQDIYAIIPNSEASIRAEPLWWNRNLKLPTPMGRYRAWSRLGILRINDVLYRGRLMTQRRFLLKYNVTVTKRVHTSLGRLIPQEWLDGLSPMNSVVRKLGLFIPDGKGELVDLENLAIKEIYRSILNKSDWTPTARSKWQTILAEHEEVHRVGTWMALFRLPYKISREVRLQSFQYSVLHRTVPCKAYLVKRKLVDSEACPVCGLRDDIFHYFYECDQAKTFWSSVRRWLNRNEISIQIPETLTEPEFLFGILSEDREDICLNYIFLLGKFYIYKTKEFGDGNLEAYGFLKELKGILSEERAACIKENALRRKFGVWEKFFNELYTFFCYNVPGLIIY